ncbi:FtsX-like permease family protein [Clostridioides mangenotii]|uniref:ABC transporter permease n=1 Tax=Metaclostridioides mangenotii TaxID=1540 RepID=UPI002149B94A|nr:FtsX-like permease family protein [Clostridioides mangenotii]MCR1953702.1 FtsX-like permease family protein [Clostridioides mangenotii]
MKAVTKTALANIKQNKGRNILSGIAIALTTILLLSTMAFGLGMVRLQAAAVNKLYPTWHIMYRDMPEHKVDTLKNHANIETLGKRIDVGEVFLKDSNVIFLNIDKNTETLNKVKLKSGKMPTDKNEIVVTEGLIKKLGNNVNVGDTVSIPYQVYEKDGLGLEKQGKFRISGIEKNENEKTDEKMFVAYTSDAFVKENIPSNQRNYRVMFRIADADKMTTENIETLAKEIAGNFGVKDGDVVINSEYLWANYVDPAMYSGIAIIALVIVAAGILTIYSIHYVSNIQKIQEFGKLKALGATKKQIKNIILKEGLLVTCFAVPIGLIVGYIISNVFFKYFVTSVSTENALSKVMIKIINDGSISLFNIYIFLLTVIVTFITVYISLIKPMITAGKISPVEAMRYGGDEKTKAKIRKGTKEITIGILTKANLSRNKKRTIITVFTLGATGILFMVVMTVLSCANPKQMAREEILFDHSIQIESSNNDKMRPELSWDNIQKNNPLNEEFEKQILDIDGVKEIKKTKSLDATLDDFKEDGKNYQVSVVAYEDSFAKQFEKNQVEGKIKYEDLKNGATIMLSNRLTKWFPDIKVGDMLNLTVSIDGKKVKKAFKVGSLVDLSFAYPGSIVIPSSVIDNMADNNITNSYEIIAEKGKSKYIENRLKSLVKDQEVLRYTGYNEKVELWENTIAIMSKVCYAFMIIIAGVGVMNLINTMINSVYSRRRELGIMQAIGLSDKQLLKMFQMEGMFYTVGTLVITLGLGNIAGYAMFLYAKENHILNIKIYNYPLIPTLILIITVILIQFMLTYAISRNFKKQSLIDRVRFSE